MSDYAREVMLSILKEEVVQNDVVDAIKNKYEVDITYGDGSNGPRRIQPVAYGKSEKGNLVLRAYQTQGDSNTDPNGWKFFLLDRIGDWEPHKDSHFPEPPNGGNGTFNPNGDEKMSEVYLVADFGDKTTGDYETAETTPTENPVTDVQQTTDTNIAGIDSQEVAAGNMQSISDMSKSQAFGDEQDIHTSGPVTKGNEATPAPQEPHEAEINNKTNYNNAMNNGPLYKGAVSGGEEEPSDEDNINNINFVDDEENNYENFNTD